MTSLLTINFTTFCEIDTWFRQVFHFSGFGSDNYHSTLFKFSYRSIYNQFWRFSTFYIIYEKLVSWFSLLCVCFSCLVLSLDYFRLISTRTVVPLITLSDFMDAKNGSICNENIDGNCKHTETNPCNYNMIVLRLPISLFIGPSNQSV